MTAQLSKSLDMQRRGAQRIPGLTQLLSKRPDQFAPGVWPGYFSRASGYRVWDLDNREYRDMSISAIGAVVLGYCDPDVDQAVVEAIRQGTATSLNCPEEVELADLLCELHPWADMARYARGGGEAMAVAVRIARAATGRDKIAFCGYHGWHDWYLAANLASDGALEGHLLPGLKPAGVPRGLQGTMMPFRYNDLGALKQILERHGSEVAAVVMEPLRSTEPSPGFLQEVRDLATHFGAALIMDEVSSGFRLVTGGAHLVYGVAPDIAVFAKALSNGYPMAAILGRASWMKRAEDTFISSTNWTDRIGPVAALATLRKHRQHNVHEHLVSMGRAVQDVWRQAAMNADLPVEIEGIAPLSHFHFAAGEESLTLMTLYVQAMLDRGFLAGNRFYANFAHDTAVLEDFRRNATEVFAWLSDLRRQGKLRESMRGPVARPGFHRLT